MNKNSDEYEISFVVPAYNESSFIERCILSIQSSCLDSNIDKEIIVVDNGSTDNTLQIASSYECRVISIERSTVSRARNIGAQEARKPIIAFIDGDVEITRKWVSTLISHYNSFLEKPFFLTGSQCKAPDDGTWIERIWFGNIKEKHLGSANMITSYRLIQATGGFDENLPTGEDYDFCERVRDLGYNYFHNPEFEAIHLGYPKTLRAFLRRERWHGRGDLLSITTIMGSKVAQASILYGFLTTLALLLLSFGYALYSLFIISILILLNAMITFIRSRKISPKSLAINYFMNALYFYARFSSIFSISNNRRYQRKR